MMNGCCDVKIAEKTDDSSLDSSDQALMDLLGLDSLQVSQHEEVDEHNWWDHSLSPKDIQQLREQYQSQSYCIVPVRLPTNLLRRITEELVWQDKLADRSYETIQILQDGQLVEQRKLTRLENFVHKHEEWAAVSEFVGRQLSHLLGVPLALFKEKLNLKPPGGSGFCPHVDAPSLQLTKLASTFCTVMIAIDDMTSENGCLRVAPGVWKPNQIATIPPEMDGNPDAGGRAGAIPSEVADTLDFINLCVKGGTVVAFDGWIPHRSQANKSHFARRAVFLTFNPREEGENRMRYYNRMEKLRSSYRDKVVADRQRELLTADEQNDLSGLSTIPRT
jgi:ectoine hydroxylase-related dioxygenase (phytanoyl-CoA dioxygenase family)